MSPIFGAADMDSTPLETTATSQGRQEDTGHPCSAHAGHGQEKSASLSRLSPAEPAVLATSTGEIACICDAQADGVGVGSGRGVASKAGVIERNRVVDVLHSPENVAARRDYEAREAARVQAECDRIVRICAERDAARPRVELTPAQRDRLNHSHALEGRAYRLRKRGRVDAARKLEEEAELLRQSIPAL